MNYTMTYAQAIKIQEDQIEFYGHRVPGGPDALRKYMKSMTRPCPDEGEDHYFEIFKINELVPRGWKIEQAVVMINKEHITGEEQYPSFIHE